MSVFVEIRTAETTLFNAFTGAKLAVANWACVTVERKEGETSYSGGKSV